MRYEKVNNITSVVTGLFALGHIEEALSIIILVLSILNIVVNMIVKVYTHLKNKEYDKIPNDIDDATDELTNLKKEGKTNE